VSYEVYALPLAPGEDPMQKLALLDESSVEAPLDPGKERRKARLLLALTAADPRLEPSERDYIAVAELLDVSEEEARARDRTVVLECPELQIGLEDDHARIELPFWPSLHNAGTVEVLQRVLGILAREAGWSGYDPQLERVIGADMDVEAFLDRFGEGVESVRGLIAEESSPPAPASEGSRWPAGA